VLSLAYKNLEANELVSVVRVRREGLGLGMVGEVLARCLRKMSSISNEEVKKCVCNIFERMFMGI